MFVYYCEQCRSLETAQEKDGKYKCNSCGNRMLPLECSLDEWNEMSNEEMLSTIVNAQDKGKPVINQPVFEDENESLKRHEYKKEIKPNVKIDRDISEKLMPCPECGKEISRQAKKCPNCGYPIGKKITISLPKSFSKKRLIVFGSIGLAVLILVIVSYFVITTFFSSNKAKSYYKNNDSASYAALDLSDKDRQELDKYYAGECERVLQSYIKEEISADDARSELVKIRGYMFDKKAYDSTNETVNKLAQSRSYYQTGRENEDKQAYDVAIEAYMSVIEEDPNYDDAQKRIEQLKIKAIDLCKSEAQNAANNENYSLAVDKISKALKIDPNNSDLLNLQNDYKTRLQQKNEQDEEKRKQAMILTPGTSFSTSHFSVDYKGGELTKGVYPDDQSGYYTYYTVKDNNNIWLDLKFRVKNTSQYETGLEDFVNRLSCTYGDSYKYDTYSLFYSNSDRIEQVYLWDNIDPLNEVTMHVCVELPEEAGNSGKSITVELSVEGVSKIIYFR